MNRELRRQMQRAAAKRPAMLTEIPRESWPSAPTTTPRLAVWINIDFLVQVFDEGNGVRRLSVNRTTVKPGGGWHENITWDDLQEIKRQIGMGDRSAVEVYPRDRDVVNVANLRHLWVLPEPLSIGWFKQIQACGVAA